MTGSADLDQSTQEVQHVSDLALLQQAMARGRNRQGVPMYVALADERRPLPVVRDHGLLADGAWLADRIEALSTTLAPSMREQDNGAVISSLVIAGHDLLEAMHD